MRRSLLTWLAIRSKCKVAEAQQNLLLSALLGLFALGNCAKFYEFKALPEGPINHQLIAVASFNHKIQARGFAGAVPAHTAISLKVGSEQKHLIAHDDGSFRLELPYANAQSRAHLSFKVNNKNYAHAYTIKDLDKSLDEIAKPALPLKEQVDDFLIDGDKALFLSSIASELSSFKLGHNWVLADNNIDYLALNPTAKQALLPRAFAVGNERALITLSGTHELMLVNLKERSLIKKTRLTHQDGSLFLFTLNPVLSVKNPLSADESSPPTTLITRSFAHSPDQVIALSPELFVVSFSNYYQFEDPSAGTEAVLAPGLIALLRVDAQGLVTKSIITLPFKNPVFINKTHHDELWVTCAGAYKQKEDRLSSTLAGLVKLKVKDDLLQITHQIALNDFVPAQPAFVGASIILPEAYGKRVAVFKETDNLSEADFKEVPEESYRFTLAAYWHSDVVFLGENSGFLIAFSLSEGFFPFPFVKPIPLDPKQSNNIVFNPVKISFRHHERGHGLDKNFKPGFSALVLSSLQSRVIPLDLLGVFGP